MITELGKRKRDQGRPQKNSPKKISRVEEGVWKSRVKKDADEKVQDHAIDLKKTFIPQKGRIYLLSKDEREEVQNFVEDQLRKNYIRPTKFP